MVAVSAKGKVFTSGSNMYGAIDSEIRSNQNDTSDEPCEITLPSGWLAKRCWACDLYTNIWVLAENGDEQKTFSLGNDYDMAGLGNGSGAPKWEKPIFPEGTYMTEIWSEGMVAFGLDQAGYMWEWGSHKVSNRDDMEPLWEICHVGAE